IPAPSFWQVHSRTLMEISALLLLSALSLFYFSMMKGKIAESASSDAKLKDELAEERAHSAMLAAQLDAALHPPALTLIAETAVPKFRGVKPSGTLKLGVPRTGQALTFSQPPQVASVTAGTQQINIDLILKAITPIAYNVGLENREGQRIWSTRVYP